MLKKMLKKMTILNVVAVATLLSTAYSSSATNPDIEKIRGRIITTLMAPPVNDTQVKELMATLRSDGTWPGIDYEDVRREAFQHTRHLSNMLTMSRAYKKKGSQYCGKKELRNAIGLSLDYWLKHDFICDNWWNNEIGTPDAITAMLLILDKDLTPVQVEKALGVVARSHINGPGARQSGDRIKIAGIQAKYTLFKRDVETFEMLVKVIEGEIRFVPTNQRGMQYDYSFHHREDHVNNTLTYGLGYADAFVEWTSYLAGTRYQLAEQAIKQLVDYYLDGICKQMVDGKYPDPSAANRDISRPGHGGAMGTRTPERLLAATDYRKEELQQIVHIREDKAKSMLSYGKFFWLSEYYVHQRPGYFTSVRMFSSRNANMEVPYNSEGLTNHHRGDGTNYVSLTGKEYFDLAPVNDWQKIPGATIMQKAALANENEIQKYGVMDFAGAVTDGMYGAAGFDFISPHDPLRARKAWFFFDSEYVCLGAGIRSQTSNPVVTTVNQCLLRNEVTVNANGVASTQPSGESQIDGVRWVYHDGIGYLFPEPAKVHLKNQAATGNWYNINRQTNIPKGEVSKDVFKLWIDHGTRLNGATYQYIVMPATNREQVASAWQTPAVTVLSNTPDMQAVWHNTLKILQTVCYKTGTLQLPARPQIGLTLNTPCILMAKFGKGSVELSVADPSRKLGKIHVSVNYRVERKGQHFLAVWNEASGQSEILIDLPQGGRAGESVTVILTSCGSHDESMEALIKDRLDRSLQQYELMAQSLVDQPDKLPRSIDGEGKLVTTGSSGWVSGFVPGSLWNLYAYSNDPKMLAFAKNYTARIEKEKHNRGTHDLGFMLYSSFGNGYRLTGDTAYRSIMLTGAESLISRFNPVIGCIRSWDFNGDKWQFPVIIDNMMNLEFLFWASRVSGDPKYREICLRHADVTLKNHVRPDFSTYHVVSYDPATGEVEKKNTHQGYADGSAWARGQAWGFYGYVVMYRETKDRKYLELAKNMATFMLHHPNLPADKIPYWDFNAPDIPKALRDASAGAIIASALIELSGYVDDGLAKEYLEVAETQIRTLSSPDYFAEKGANGNFIIKHCVGNLPGNSEMDVPLTYADYYYIEALMRYRTLLKK